MIYIILGEVSILMIGKLSACINLSSNTESTRRASYMQQSSQDKVAVYPFIKDNMQRYIHFFTLVCFKKFACAVNWLVYEPNC